MKNRLPAPAIEAMEQAGQGEGGKGHGAGHSGPAPGQAKIEGCHGGGGDEQALHADPAGQGFVENRLLGIPGLLFEQAVPGGSIPRAIAGRLSVRRLINSRCTGAKGTGRASREVYSTHRMPAVLPESRKVMAFLMLVKTLRPLTTALTMVAKLSSAKIMEAASLLTSVPVIPMATPMSAFFRAARR